MATRKLTTGAVVPGDTWVDLVDAEVEGVWLNTVNRLTNSAGSSTVYTATATPDFLAGTMAFGTQVVFVPHVTCGNSPTLNVDSLGPFEMVKPDGTGDGANIVAGDLVVNNPYTFEFRTTYFMLVTAIGPASIPDSSITTVKLNDLSVTTAKLADVAVTTPKIAALAVNDDKLATGAVITSKIAALAVDSTKLADVAVTTAKIAALAVNDDKLAASSVITDKIAASAVTTAKIAALAVDGTKIALGAVDTAQLADVAITTPKIAALAVNDDKLAAGAVITSKIAALAVDGTKIALGGVSTAQLADNGVSTAKLANNAVTSIKIIDDAVTTGKLANLAVDSSKLADIAVTTAKIAALAVNDDKLATSAVITSKIAALAVDGTKIALGAVSTAQMADSSVATGKLANDAVTSIKIIDAAVTTNKINAGAVVTSKIADLAVDSGKIALQAVATAQLADVAVTTAKIAALAVDGARIALGAVSTAQMADAAVTTGKLGNDAVTALKIIDGAVTSDKLGAASVTNAKLGTDAVTAIKIQDSAVTAQKLATDSVISTKIATGAVSTVQLADNGVTNAKVANDAITATKIATGSVTGAKIADGVITEDKLANSVVTSGKIATGAVGSSKLADDAVTAAKIDDGAVVTAGILNAAVTNAKLATMTAPGFKGAVVAGTPIDMTAEQARTLLNVSGGALNNYPGWRPEMFTSTLLGSFASVASLSDSQSAYDTDGRVYRNVAQEIIVAQRTPFRLEPGRRYQVRAVYRRRLNTTDPAEDAVVVAVQWLNNAQNTNVGTTTISTGEPNTASGRVIVSAIVAAAAGADIDFVAPANSIYGRAYVRTYGITPTTDIELIEVTDVTDTELLTPDVTGVEARLTALESETLSARLEVTEAALAGRETDRFKTRSDAAAAAIAGDILPSVDLIRVLGNTDDGDGRAKIYIRDAIEPTGGDYFDDDDGSFWRRVADVQFGDTGVVERVADFATFRSAVAASNIQTLGRLEPGDGGGAIYVQGSAPAALTLGFNFHRRQDYDGNWYETTTRRELKAEEGGVFGGSDTTDVGGILQDMSEWLSGKGGGSLLLPPGLVKMVTRPVISWSGVKWIGSARSDPAHDYGTRISFARVADGPKMQVGGNGVQIHDFGIERVKMIAEGGIGHCIQTRNLRGFRAGDFNIGQCFGLFILGEKSGSNGGVANNATTAVRLWDIEGSLYSEAGNAIGHVLFENTTGQVFLRDLHFEGHASQAAGSDIYGFRVPVGAPNRPDGLTATDVCIRLVDIGWDLDGGLANAEIKGGYLDGMYSHAYRFGQGSTTDVLVSGQEMAGFLSGTFASIGVLIDEVGGPATTETVRFIGNTIKHFGAGGVHVLGGSNIQVTHNFLMDVTVAADNTHDALYIGPLVEDGYDVSSNQVNIQNQADEPRYGLNNAAPGTIIGRSCDNTIGPCGTAKVTTVRGSLQNKRVVGNTGQVLEGSSDTPAVWMQSNIPAGSTNVALTIGGETGVTLVVAAARGRIVKWWGHLSGTMTDGTVTVRTVIAGSPQVASSAMSPGTQFVVSTNLDGIEFNEGDTLGMVYTSSSSPAIAPTSMELKAGMVIVYD